MSEKFYVLSEVVLRKQEPSDWLVVDTADTLQKAIEQAEGHALRRQRKTRVCKTVGEFQLTYEWRGLED